MGLIIKDKIPALKVGYPTVSDKYNVAGAVLDPGSAPVQFGDVLAYGATAGYFKKASAITAAADVAGFIIATNVKLATDWPGTTVETLPGEAFNLLINGFMAVALDSTAVAANIKPNVTAYVTAAGKLTTVATNNFALTGVVFTGTYEMHGTTIVAEIYVK